MSSSTKRCRCDKETGHRRVMGRRRCRCRLSFALGYFMEYSTEGRGLVRVLDPCLSDSLIGLHPGVWSFYRPQINRRSFSSALLND
jgi:hypothetical protein